MKRAVVSSLIVLATWAACNTRTPIGVVDGTAGGAGGAAGNGSAGDGLAGDGLAGDGMAGNGMAGNGTAGFEFKNDAGAGPLIWLQDRLIELRSGSPSSRADPDSSAT